MKKKKGKETKKVKIRDLKPKKARGAKVEDVKGGGGISGGVLGVPKDS